MEKLFMMGGINENQPEQEEPQQPKKPQCFITSLEPAPADGDYKTVFEIVEDDFVITQEKDGRVIHAVKSVQKNMFEDKLDHYTAELVEVSPRWIGEALLRAYDEGLIDKDVNEQTITTRQI